MNKIPIIYQDDDLAVIDKPADILVHKVKDTDNIYTVVDFIKDTWSETAKYQWPDASRPGIVHRLDKDTSGLLLIAKNPRTLKYLQDQFRTHTIKKVYQLLCLGKLPQSGEIKTFTSRDPKLYNKQKISLMSFSWQNKAREAITKYRTINYLKYHDQILSLAEAEIVTGRTHQIRNHFLYLGYPIIGDQMYYTKESKSISDSLGLKRQFLHSSTIEFITPDGKIKKVKSELPSDLNQILENLQKGKT